MIPNTKISNTIVEFGKELVLGLPENCSKEEMEAAMSVIILAWNAVVIDSWNNTTEYETELLASMENDVDESVVMVKRLIKRKKKKFSEDPRAVGKHWIKEENGNLIFGCEARLDIDKVRQEGTWQ